MDRQGSLNFADCYDDQVLPIAAAEGRKVLQKSTVADNFSVLGSP